MMPFLFLEPDVPKTSLQRFITGDFERLIRDVDPDLHYAVGPTTCAAANVAQPVPQATSSTLGRTYACVNEPVARFLLKF